MVAATAESLVSCPRASLPAVPSQPRAAFPSVLQETLQSSKSLFIHVGWSPLSVACSQRTLSASVGISFCPRRGVRVGISQLQGINLVSITPFLPQVLGVPRAGWGKEKGRTAGSVD